MSYTTLAALTEKFGEQVLINLTDRGETPTGVIDTSVVDQAIDLTQAVIDGFLGVRYALPLAEVPPLIGKLALDLTIYELHIYTPDDKIVADHKAATAMLQRIADGKIRLPLEGRETPGSGNSGARITDRERPLTETSLKGFI